MQIHKSAVIADGASIDETVSVGPFAVIGPNVKIGSGTKVGAHVVIDGFTTIGENCQIFPGVTIGLEPQDFKYKGEETGVILGNNVVLREYVTVHRATGEGFTLIGDDCFFMNYAHVAHNCRLGKGVIMANSTILAGYCEVGDGAVFSGVCVFHQFVRIGRLCMIGGMTGTRVDLPPFTLCDGRPAMVRGLNVVGLRRNKITSVVRAGLKQAYKLIYRSGLNYSQAIARIEEEIEPTPEIQEVCNFFRNSKRGVAPGFSELLEKTHEVGEIEDAPVEVI